MSLLRSYVSPMAILLMLASTVCYAQTRIPTDAPVSDRPLTGDQEQAINGYVDHWCGELMTASDEDVTLARVKLLEQISPIAKEYFLDYYSSRVAAGLNKAIDNPRVITRINALVVANRLPKNVCSLMQQLGLQALTDTNPAVRYWAAKLLARVAEICDLSSAEKKSFIALLVQAIQAEQSDTVLQQLFVALANVDTEDAFNSLLDVLEKRIEMYAGQPGLSVSAELAAIQRLQVLLITAAQQKKGFTDNVNIKFARMLLLYEHLMAKTVQTRNNRDELVMEEYKTLLVRCDEFLSYIVGQMAPSQSVPPPIMTYVISERWSEILLRIEMKWIEILQDPPFNYSREELEVNI